MKRRLVAGEQKQSTDDSARYSRMERHRETWNGPTHTGIRGHWKWNVNDASTYRRVSEEA
jgi:hypothetical protein